MARDISRDALQLAWESSPAFGKQNLLAWCYQLGQAEAPARAAVAGEFLPGTLNDFVRSCEVHLAEEQAKALPDSALIGLLCSAVRLARENARVVPRIGSSDADLNALRSALLWARDTSDHLVFGPQIRQALRESPEMHPAEFLVSLWEREVRGA